jgi:hypothetical protein
MRYFITYQRKSGCHTEEVKLPQAIRFVKHMLGWSHVDNNTLCRLFTRALTSALPDHRTGDFLEVLPN